MMKNLKTLMVKSYLKAFLAIVISGIFSIILINVPAVAIPIFKIMSIGGPIFSTILVIALLMFLMVRLNTAKSSGQALAYFALISMFFGINLTAILMMYSFGQVFKVFFITSIYFLLLALFSFVSKRDFTKMGNVLFISLLALIIVSIINLFLGLPQLDMILAFVSLVIFTFYTIYDHQSIIKRAGMGDIDRDKFELASYQYGMQLYLDFINLFQSLLRIIGNN